MSRSAPRTNHNRQPSTHSSHPNDSSSLPPEHSHLGHPHGYGHGRTRSHQLQVEAQHRQHPFQQQQQQQQHPYQQQQSQQQSQQQQQHQYQQPHPTTSDYNAGVDTSHHMAPRPSAQPAAALAGRSNPELNLGVLRRYLPSITSVLSIAANAVVYTFQPPSEWKRTNIEGPIFICLQRKAPGSAGETGCLFILNRKGLQNFIIDLDNVVNFELADDLLIFKLEHAVHEVPLESGEVVSPLVLGLWTYAEVKSDRETNATLVHDMWDEARSTRQVRAQAAASDPAMFASLAEEGPAAQATGRRLSVTDLFSAYNGNSLPAEVP